MPILTQNKSRMSLCYEVHGLSDTNFNLVSDKCVNVNAHYISTNLSYMNVIDAIGVKAKGHSGICTDIVVHLEGCTVSVQKDTLTAELKMYKKDGITIRQYTKKVRISIPNCEQTTLVMWVICEDGNENFPDMIRFWISRGVNLRPTSHGLLGKKKYLIL